MSDNLNVEQLDNGIVVFTFKNARRDTVDEWLTHLTQLQEETAWNETVKYIVDIRESGTVPSAYAFRAGQRWLRENRNFRMTYTAFVHKPSTSMSITSSFINMLRINARWKVKMINDYDEAIEWLLEQPDKSDE